MLCIVFGFTIKQRKKIQDIGCYFKYIIRVKTYICRKLHSLYLIYISHLVSSGTILLAIFDLRVCVKNAKF